MPLRISGSTVAGGATQSKVQTAATAVFMRWSPPMDRSGRGGIGPALLPAVRSATIRSREPMAPLNCEKEPPEM
jgi:hypothetical protein